MPECNGNKRPRSAFECNSCGKCFDFPWEFPPTTTAEEDDQEEGVDGPSDAS